MVGVDPVLVGIQARIPGTALCRAAEIRDDELVTLELPRFQALMDAANRDAVPFCEFLPDAAGVVEVHGPQYGEHETLLSDPAELIEPPPNVVGCDGSATVMAPLCYELGDLLR